MMSAAWPKRIDSGHSWVTPEMPRKRASQTENPTTFLAQAPKQPKDVRAGLYARVSTHDQQMLAHSIGECGSRISRAGGIVELKRSGSTFIVCLFMLLPPLVAQQYDIVLQGGRVIDPESNLDAIRNVGISGNTVRAITQNALTGRTVVDARGLIVAPGFIDLHAHGQNLENDRAHAMDGVTAALDLEGGTVDVDSWYAAQTGKRLIHYGAAVSHTRARRTVMGGAESNNRGGPPACPPECDAIRNPATDDQISQIQQIIAKGLERGAPAVGLGIQYMPGASRWEILQTFRTAAPYHASLHPHIRYAGLKEPESVFTALEEVIADAAVSGAALHVLHLQSNGLGGVPKLLGIIEDAQKHGIDITGECYPYGAGMGSIRSALFDPGWQEKLGISYGDLVWVATGERLTEESFNRYRKVGGFVIAFVTPESAVDACVISPQTAIATDGLLEKGQGHPRTSGTYSLVLGRYVRERKLLTWQEAIRKMTLMPAKRLEARVPMMKAKGRLRVGADADITVFDPEQVVDRSTYEEPGRYSEGIRFVLVGGTFVVRDGALKDGAPGQPIRAPIASQPK
jgi:N-acyl-D-aspartate/D-glutamate deacylase